jgi:hypothetical protein
VILKEAYADGFTQEVLPADIGNRKISLFIKLSPPIITSQTTPDRQIFFRWFDANTNKTIPHTTFLVGVEKHGKEIWQSLYHSHTGILKLKITPSNDPSKWKTDGIPQPFFDGYMYVPKGNDTIDEVSPILGEGGLYHIVVMLITIDSDQNFFPPNITPTFDAFLSVGDISNNTINYQNNSYNITLVSYYDKISSFHFDESNYRISWSMPFDWNTTRFQNLPIFVHEEIRIPKTFKEFTSTPTFTASVNGNPIVSRNMIVDPYSITDDYIIHLLLNKNDIENLAKNFLPSEAGMNFTVRPALANVTTSRSLLTDLGGLGVNLEWSSSTLVANTQNNLKLTFYDAFTEQQIKGDVNYSLKILDASGNTIDSQTDVAANGSSVLPINLPSNGIYEFEMAVKSITYNGLPDTSRAGLARGSLVIPSLTVSNGSQAISIPSNPNSVTSVPSWIKKTAKWWSEGQVDDADFVKGFLYMIQNKIIKISLPAEVGSSQSVPQWIKHNAGWWSSGQISDEEFVKGIVYLFNN